jgi:hypothetical protein
MSLSADLYEVFAAKDRLLEQKLIQLFRDLDEKLLFTIPTSSKRAYPSEIQRIALSQHIYFFSPPVTSSIHRLCTIKYPLPADNIPILYTSLVCISSFSHPARPSSFKILSPLNPTVFDLLDDGSKYYGKPLVTLGRSPSV